MTPTKKLQPKKGNLDKYRQIFNNFTSGIVYQDKNGNVTDANTAALRMLNLSIDEIRGKTPYINKFKFLREDLTEVKEFPCNKVLQTGKAVLNTIIGFLNTSTNTIQWFKTDCFPCYDELDETTDRISTVFTDITSTKNNELFLKKNEQRYQKAQQIDKSGSWEYNFNTQKIWVSKEVLRIFGINSNKSIFPLNSFEKYIIDKTLIKNTIEELLVKGKKYNTKFRIQPKNRVNEKIIATKIELSYNDDGSIAKANGIVKDITRIVKRKEELERRNDFMSTITQNHPAAIVVCNAARELVLFNETAKKWHGVDILKAPREEWSKNYDLYNAKTNKLLETHEIPLIKAFNGEKVENIEMIIKAKNQNPRYVLCNGAAFFNKNRKKMGALIIMNDITELKNKEQNIIAREITLRKKLAKIEKKEFFLKESAEIAKIGGWQLNLKTNQVSWSDQVFKIHGLPIGQLPSLEEALNFFIDGSKEILQSAIQESMLKNQKYDLELRFQNAQKKKLWVHTIGYPITDKDEKVIGLRGIFQDITEQKLIREQSKKYQEIQLLLAKNTSDIICLQKPDSTFTYVTPSIEPTLGYKQKDFIGKKAFELLNEEDYEFLRKKILNNNGEPITFKAKHVNGTPVWLEFLSSPVYDNEKISYYVISARNVTRWMLAKQKIHEYKKSLQKLTNEITIIEEKQKKQIAANIHDNLSQSLVISKMKLNMLRKNSELKNIDDDLDFIDTHISDALENSRKITFELSPPILYQLGIIEAVSWLLEKLGEKHKIKFKLETTLFSVNLKETKAILIYRSVQELLANALKYAKATVVTVQIKQAENRVIISVIDNGIGFNTKNVNAHEDNSGLGSGFGLFTIKERVNNLKGNFIINSNINAGTKVSISIPVDHD